MGMTNAPGGQGPHPGTDSFFDTLRRIDLRRGPDRWIGGVATGIGRRFGLDPLVIRIAFVVAAVIFGFGIALYLWAWLLIPDQDERTHLEQGLRDGRGESIALLVVSAFATIGVLPWWGGPGNWWGGGWWFASVVLTVAVVIGVVVLLRSTGALGQSGSYRTGGDPSRTTVAPPPPDGTGTSGQAPVGSGTYGWPGHQATGVSGPGWAGEQGSASGGSRPPGAPSQQRAPRPPRPTAPRPIRERRKTGGAVVGLIATGLAMLTFGGLLWAGSEYDLPGNDLALACAGVLAVLGLLIAILGAAGRHSGWAGFLAVVTLIGTVAFAPLPESYPLSTRVGQDLWRPTSAQVDEPFALGAGEGILDLSELDPAELDGETISVDVNIGHLRIQVPEDLTVRIEAGSGIGTINLSDTGQFDNDGFSVSGGLNVVEDVVVGDGPVDLVIDAQVGIGQVTVERN